MNQSDYLSLDNLNSFGNSQSLMSLKEVCSVIPESFIILSVLFILYHLYLKWKVAQKCKMLNI